MVEGQRSKMRERGWISCFLISASFKSIFQKMARFGMQLTCGLAGTRGKRVGPGQRDARWHWKKLKESRVGVCFVLFVWCCARRVEREAGEGVAEKGHKKDVTKASGKMG